MYNKCLARESDQRVLVKLDYNRWNTTLVKSFFLDFSLDGCVSILSLQAEGEEDISRQIGLARITTYIRVLKSNSSHWILLDFFPIRESRGHKLILSMR